jgi:hypothetical protein
VYSKTARDHTLRHALKHIFCKFKIICFDKRVSTLRRILHVTHRTTNIEKHKTRHNIHDTIHGTKQDTKQDTILTLRHTLHRTSSTTSRTARHTLRHNIATARHTLQHNCKKHTATHTCACRFPPGSPSNLSRGGQARRAEFPARHERCLTVRRLVYHVFRRLEKKSKKAFSCVLSLCRQNGDDWSARSGAVAGGSGRWAPRRACNSDLSLPHGGCLRACRAPPPALDTVPGGCRSGSRCGGAGEAGEEREKAR